MGKIVFENKLDFLTRFNEVKNIVVNNIHTQLSECLNDKVKSVEGSKILKVIQYKDLDNWSANLKSDTLIALSNKISHMVFNIGCPNSVVPMLQAILKGTKRLKYPNNPEANCVGHFKWNYQVYILNKRELGYLKKIIDKNLVESK